MTTPEPSPLSEQELQDFEARLDRGDFYVGVFLRSDEEAVRFLKRLIAQARAARPSPTCATCLHDANCEIQQAAGNYSNPAFGCTLHEPSPPAQDGGRP